MSEQCELDLLIDIAKLIKKYGPDTFERLANALSSPDFVGQLEIILIETAKVSRQVKPVTKRNKSPQDLRSELVALEREDPVKGKLLLIFYDGLLAKKILPTMKDFQEYIVEIQLPAKNLSSRSKMMVSLVKHLLGLSIEEIQEKLSYIKPVAVSNDRSLQGWTDIILKKKLN